MRDRQQRTSEEKTLKKRGRLAQACLLTAVFLWVGFLGVLGFLSYLTGENRVLRFSPLDQFVAQKMEIAAGDVPFSASTAGIVAGSSFWNPAYMVENLVVFDQNNRAVVEIDEFKLDFSSALRNQLSGADGVFRVSGANVFITRDVRGQFNLGNLVNDEEFVIDEEIDLGARIDQIARDVFNDQLSQIRLDNVTLFYSDQKTRTANLFTDGELTLSLEDGQLEIAAGLREDLREGSDSWVRINLNRKLDDDISDLDFTFERVDSQLIAEQFQAFNWLKTVEARISASFVAQIGRELEAVDFAGVVDLGKGRIRETENNPAAEFDAIKAYFDYEAKEQSFRFSSIELDTSLGSIQASGSAELLFDNNQAEAARYDMVIDRITIPSGRFYDEPREISGGVLRGEVKFDPIIFAFEHAAFIAGDAHIEMNGAITSAAGQWNSALSARIDKMEISELLEFWPKGLATPTQNWMRTNIVSGWYSNGDLLFSRRDGEIEFDFSFDFGDGEARVLKTAPRLQAASGRAHLDEITFTAWVDQGQFTTEYGALNAAGSIFRIKDIRKKPADGQVEISARGPLRAGLSMLNIEKFKFLDKMGRDENLARGQANLSGVIDFVTGKNPPKGSTIFDLQADLTEFQSDNLVKDQSISADALKVLASNDQISIEGDVVISGLPASVKWSQALQNNPDQISNLRAELELSRDGLDSFGFELPAQSYDGSADAVLLAELRPNTDAAFELKSDMVGAAIRIPILGWRKPADAVGDLEILGRFGKVPQIESLSFVGKGLDANGRLILSEDGGLARAEFDRVSTGGWFDAAVTIDSVENVTRINGNKLDLRRLNLSRARGERSGALDISLGSLRITDAIALTNFNGRLGSGRATKGQFTARINGGPAIKGSIYPDDGRTRIDVSGQDAGAVLRAAGLLDSVDGGAITLSLFTTGEEDVYRSYFQARKFRLRHSNALATLMDGLSLVGLLQKLEGDGIYFDQARGEVMLTPNGATLTDVSVTGASMGMTLNGDYASASKALDFEGVLTPFYFINGTPERVIGREFGTKKGSGLISMVYEIVGTADKPKVKAKPLSILAPGPLKNLFKRKNKKATN